MSKFENRRNPDLFVQFLGLDTKEQNMNTVASLGGEIP
jgi:hypothetical protein